MIGQGRPTILAVVAACAWLAGASLLAAQETAAPADSLRVIAHRDPLIFAPGEQFTFDLEPLLAGVEPSTAIDIAASLTSAGKRTTRWNTQQRVQVPLDGHAIATLHVPLPREEGVYEIHLDVTRPPGFRDRWFPGGNGAPLVERSFQVVVLDRLPPAPVPDAEWREIVNVDPTNPAWTTKIPDWTQIRRIPGMSRRPIGSVRAKPVSTTTGTYIELPPAARGEAHWQAYPLAIESTSGPHLLEVEYPADQEQHLRISIIEPGVTGETVSIGRDSGVYVEGLGASERAGRQKHRVVFWPRTHAPLVLISNQHPTAVGRFGHLRVFKRTASTLATDQWPAASLQERWVAAYLTDPLQTALAGNGPAARRDWLSLYDGAVRLAEYLNYAGFNAAAIDVMSPQASLVPLELLFSQADPEISPIEAEVDVPTDGLELMLRVFDRTGMVCVPTIELATPLPALESLCRQIDPHSGGIELVGPGGLTWSETHAAGPISTPRYNLLDPRVQQAVVELMQRFDSRYGRHPSFQLLAVRLSARGYGALPGLEWGLDDTTIGRFERETGVRLQAEGAQRFALRQNLLTGKYADLWRGWRAEQITHFYQRLAQAASATNSQRRLLLTTEALFDEGDVLDRLRPNVAEKTNLPRAMLEMGIDWGALGSSPGLVALPTRYVGTMVPLVDCAMDLSVNEGFASLPGPAPAMVLYRRPQRQSIAAASSLAAYGATAPAISQSAAHAAAARKPYLDALAINDPTIILDGGPLATSGEEEALRELRAFVRALPPGAAVEVNRARSVSVRTYNDRGQAVMLVMNECPWQADVTIDIAADMPVTALPLLSSRSGTSRTTVEQFAAGQQLWSLQLAPYDVHAVRFTGGTPRVERIDAQISEAGMQELAGRVNELKERDLIALPRYSALKNPGFEPSGAAALPAGWQFVGNPATAKAQLDANNPQELQTCLYLANQGGGTAAIVSDEFVVPPTGQLGMLAYIRGENCAAETTLRLVFEIEGQPTRYRRYSVLGGNRPDAIPIAADWGGGYAFGQNDLPLDARAQMRVKFELSGPGEVWIDNVQLYDLLFPLSFYVPGEGERLQLVKRRAEVVRALQSGELAACVRTIEGYWPRFINAYTPRVASPIANQSPAIEAPAPQSQQPPAETPSVSKRSWYNFWSR